ncbi:hypothetical protein DFP72DRAFT_798461 [Ephemerocybe angulata]|uniref:RNase H type-1 domain-containing protein n=1 Tax=Ephemerocybe angulata TaxID=980116 RepID=A0A8H6IIU7_9AGAR|nr:hypothetical protein DFP72DRAFT_798461 [Tulosesus angulatus]
MLEHAEGGINHPEDEPEESEDGDSSDEDSDEEERPGNGQCRCTQCREDEEVGCENPKRCRGEALKFLGALGPKWRPNISTDEEVDPEPRHETQQEQKETWRREDEKGRRLFRNQNTIGSIKEGLRVFADAHDISHDAPPTHLRDETSPPKDPTVVYTDGACDRNGDLDAEAGAGVHFQGRPEKDVSTRVPERLPQTNNTGEALAILLAVQQTPENEDLIVRTDSQLIMDALTKNLSTIEAEGWGAYDNREVLEPTIAALRARPGRVFFEKVKGHSGDAGNDKADELAGKAVSDNKKRRIDLNTPVEQRITGTKLTNLTQSKAYKGILAWKRAKTGGRLRTLRMLDRIREETARRIGRVATNGTIWKSLISKNIVSKKVRAFMWKATHDCVPCGHIWAKVKGLEDRSRCDSCGCTESLEHILTECTRSGQELVWRLVRLALEEKGIEWEDLTLGTILGCAVREQKKKDDRRPGQERAYAILVSEAAFLIWKIRCEWRIGRNEEETEAHSDEEIENRWRFMMNAIIEFDYLSSNKERYGTKATDAKLVEATWGGLLEEREKKIKIRSEAGF